MASIIQIYNCIIYKIKQFDYCYFADYTGHRSKKAVKYMENKVLLLFCGMLALCVAGGFSILYALLAGLVLFCGYARKRGYGWRAIGAMVAGGFQNTKNILLTFVLIGALTGLWRLCGTLPFILCVGAGAIRGKGFLVMTFLLNCGVSVLTGTALGTAATMGSVCGVVGTAMGVAPALTGGAVLAGAYFGDRCSPVSTSALLISELTNTALDRNIRGMVQTAAVPFLLSCGVYLALGWVGGGEGVLPDLRALFGGSFRLSWLCLLPAVVMLVLPALGVKVRLALAVSILLSALEALLLQGSSPGQIIGAMALGYSAPAAEVGAMLNGGGVVSMLRVSAILCISSGYAGIFKETGLLNGFRTKIAGLGGRITKFGATLWVAVLAGAVACNQPLAILLTCQLCEGVTGEGEELALALEDTVAVTAPLIPWSVASASPLSSVGAPTASILAACFLYLLPLWRWVRAVQKGKG